MVLAGLSFLAAADPTALTAQAQAECLQAFERADAMATAARAWFLGAFTAGQGYTEDADYSPTAWLIHRTRVTKGAARDRVGWARRAVTHPQVLLALAESAVVTESIARLICAWTDRLPAGIWASADDILLAAARAGARKEDLAGRGPRRSTPGRCPGVRTTRSPGLRTGRCGWRPPSLVPGSSAET